MAIELYYAPGTCAFAALAALEQAEADYSTHRLDLAEGDQRQEGFRALNPLGRVPVMLAEGETITEIIAVLTYIAARFPEAGLTLKADPVLLAKEYEWLAWFSTSIHLHIAQIFRSERFSDQVLVQDALKLSGRRQFAEDLTRVEAKCATPESVYTADRFGLVNAFGLVIWRWAQRLEIDTAPLPIWSSIVAHDLTRPSVVDATGREANGTRALITANSPH